MDKKKINFQNTKFVLSSTSENFPSLRMNEVLFVGRSNVGKSSLINALTNTSGLAKVSSTPGHTRLLNYFNVDDTFYIVDSPGYGYAKRKNKEILSYGKMMEEYLTNPYLKLVIFLIDSRRLLNEDDLLLLDYFLRINKHFLFVLTKEDKLNQSERYKANKYFKDTFPNVNYLFVSSTKNKGLDALKDTITNSLFNN